MQIECVCVCVLMPPWKFHVHPIHSYDILMFQGTHCGITLLMVLLILYYIELGIDIL